MRKFFCCFMLGGLGALLLTFSAGCSTSLYEDSENWAIADNDTPAFFSEYDLIFLYPSPENNPENGYLNWVCGDVGKDIRHYVRLVIAAQFGQRVRVFSPYVPMVGFRKYGEIMEEFKRHRMHDFNFYKTDLREPIDYMVEALDVYFKYYNPDDHPFVIYGQGQGALVLYEAMKRCRHIKVSNGFVAGYFFGLPGVTKEEILDEFGSRDIKPASNRNGVGAIVICNTRREGDGFEKTLALTGGAVINPLNWRTDAVQADKSTNPGSFFFNHREHNPMLKVKEIPHFCGAVVDSENGLVTLIGIPKNTPFKIDEHHFFSDAWGLFAKSVSRNARERVSMYKFMKYGVKLPE